MGNVKLTVAWILFLVLIAVMAGPIWAMTISFRALTRLGLWSFRSRRRFTSGVFVRWLDRLFRLLSWGYGGSSVNSPDGILGRPAVLIVNRRSDLDFFAVGHFCRRLGLENVRWILRSSGFWAGLFSFVAGDLCMGGNGITDGGMKLQVFVTASLERDDGVSFVLFPESRKYDPEYPDDGWLTVKSPRTTAFRRLCAALSSHDVVTVAMLWRSATCRSSHFVTILSERHEGLPGNPGKWLRQEWRRVEATLLPYCD